MSGQPLWKPTKLERDLSKWARRVDREKRKAAERRAEAAVWSDLRKRVFARDGGRCRAYGLPLKLYSVNPLEQAHTHHIVFRSAGGQDVMSNLITLSPAAHQQIHQHKLDVAGDGNGVVTFTVRHLETGKVVEQWTSEVGQ